jgi:AAA domain/UvrD-like helicase C-terminal domain
MSSLDDLILTEEQEVIVNTCCAPDATIVSLVDSDGSIGPLVRITAAAGAGKTTTLLALALQAIELGHTHISYVTFTNAAAKDGQRRIDDVLTNYHQQQTDQHRQPITVEARTLHSFAMRLLGLDQSDTTRLFWTETKVQKWINMECSAAIDKFLVPCYRELEEQSRNQQKGRGRINQAGLEERRSYALKKVQFFLYKSLRHFCQNSWTWHEYLGLPEYIHYDEYRDGACFKYCKPDKNILPFARDYYPIKLFHTTSRNSGDSLTKKSNGEGLGFDPKHYSKNIEWYAMQVGSLWLKICLEDIHSFDFDMKRVQLYGNRIPGTMLLVDESQDMDGCQIDWAIKQQVTKFKTLTYVVGDPAQSIYGFRGAKPKYLMDLVSYHDFKLTESWRFGNAISRIANLILHCKEKSDPIQTNKRTWIPYRVRPGLVNKKSTVTMESLIQQWKKSKVTVIAFSNVKLLIEALDVLGFSLTSTEGEDSDSDIECTQDTAASTIDSSIDDDGSDSDDYLEVDDGEDEEFDNASTANDVDDTNNIPIHLPKIHINGNGENSGMKLWKKTLKVIDGVFQLFRTEKESGDSGWLKLDSKLFPDFAGRTVTWSSFVDECEQRELQRYNNAIHVVKVCKMKTPEAISKFQEYVLDQKYTAQDADIILTTCHSAKGMEWDNVHVCDDFEDLCNFKQEVSFFSSFKFGFESWADSLNLLYVACTRAKQKLFIPPNISTLLQVLDEMYCMVHGSESDTKQRNLVGYQIPGYKTPLSEQNIRCFIESIIMPLRKEFDLSSQDLLVEALVVENEDSSRTGLPGKVPEADMVRSRDAEDDDVYSVPPKVNKGRSGKLKVASVTGLKPKADTVCSVSHLPDNVRSWTPNVASVTSLNPKAHKVCSLNPKPDKVHRSKRKRKQW